LGNGLLLILLQHTASCRRETSLACNDKPSTTTIKKTQNPKTELHLGDKAQVEMLPEDKNPYPPIESFTQKISGLNPNSGSVHLCGAVKAVLGKTGFTRGDSDGVVLRLALRDDSGEATVVVWNEKVDEVERKLRDGAKLLLVNARVKEGKNGGLEVHVDSNTAIEVQN